MTKAIIETPRLQLREMVWDDKESIAAILQDERVMYAYNGAFSEEETDAWIERQRQRYKEYGFGLWAVLQKESSQVIGQCGITMQEYKGRLVPEIGYLFACKHWHKGYATEAATACKKYASDVLKVKEVCSIIRDTNIASQKVALRLGMKKTDVGIKHYKGIDMPHYLYVANLL